MSENFSVIYGSRNVYSEIGYHTTLKENKESIQINGFKPSKDDDDWLGEGVYFWDDFKAAQWWMHNKKTTQKCIFICCLNCSLSNYLNLDNRLEMNKFEMFSKRYIQEMAQSKGKKPSFKNNSQRRKFFCDIYCSKNNISILSFTFEHDIINNVGFKQGTFHRKQICVRELNCISIVDIKE